MNYDASWHGVRAQETWIFSSTSNLATLKLHYSCLMGGCRMQTLICPWILKRLTRHGTLRSVAVNDSRVWVGVIHPEQKTRGRTVASCPQTAGTLPQESISHIRGEHPVGSTQPRPFATLINKNIIPVVTDFWRSAKLLANLCWQMIFWYGPLLLAWLPFSVYCYFLLCLQFFAVLFIFCLCFSGFFVLLTTFFSLFSEHFVKFSCLVICVCLPTYT